VVDILGNRVRATTGENTGAHFVLCPTTRHRYVDESEGESMPSVRLPKPTPALVRSYIRRFDKEEDGVERTLTKLFRLFPKNTTLEDVLLKVAMLNATLIMASATPEAYMPSKKHLNICGTWCLTTLAIILSGRKWPTP
jgi:hypothetical protein